MRASEMQLGLMWGSGVTQPAILRFAQRWASSGGYRARFGTELWDEAESRGTLRKALRRTSMAFTWEEDGDEVVPGVNHYDFLAICEAANLPVLLTIDPMAPGGPQGDGYHQAPLKARLSFPDYKIVEFEEFVIELLAFITAEFPKLLLSGLQWGNEVDYLPYVEDWKTAYDRYWRALVSLGEILPSFYPGAPVVAGGQAGGRRFRIPLGRGETQDRQGLTWFCGRRSRTRWGDRRAPLVLAFHSLLSFRGAAPHPKDVRNVEDQIRGWGKRLRKFGHPIWLTELAAFEEFERLGGAAADAGIDGLWAIADHWLQPRWGVDAGGKTNTRGLGFWGAEGWPNERTRESFKNFARTVL